jgi:hypothetical protein
MKYIEELGVFTVKINRAFERAQQEKSKPACFVEFERVSDGAITSLRLQNPLSKADFFKISKLVEAVTGKRVSMEELAPVSQANIIKRLDSFKGQTLNVYVKPFELNTGSFKKTMWNVEDTVSAKYVLPTATPSDDSLGEDIPF